MLLKRHVAWLNGGHASGVSYTGFAKDRSPLAGYLESLSGVSEGEFDSYPEQAFFMCGGLEDVERKWAQIQKDTGA